MSVEKAKKIVLDSVSLELFAAKQSAAIWRNIADCASALNGTAYQQVFGIVQRDALASLILSLGKIYEAPGKKYPNVSIPSALKYLRDDFNKIPVNSSSLNKLEEFASDYKLKRDDFMSAEEVKTIVLGKLSDQCPQLPARSGISIDEAFDKVKALRDKQIAHSEDVDVESIPMPTWNAVEQLIAFAETFVNLIGYGFFGFSIRGKVEPEDLNLGSEPMGQKIKSVVKIVTTN